MIWYESSWQSAGISQIYQPASQLCMQENVDYAKLAVRSQHLPLILTTYLIPQFHSTNWTYRIPLQHQITTELLNKRTSCVYVSHGFAFTNFCQLRSAHKKIQWHQNCHITDTHTAWRQAALQQAGGLLLLNKPHFRSTSHVVRQRLNFLKQLRRAGVPPAQLLHFYMAVIRPVLEYPAPVWHHLLTKAHTDQI